MTEKVLNLNNLSINTLVSGSGERTIFFIHGNSSSAASWQPQLNDPELQKRYQLIAIDLPGHGKSGKSQDYRMKAMAQVIPALVAHLDLKEYLLTGLSYGTCLVAEAAPALKGCKGFFMASSNITNNEHPPGSYIVPFPEAAALVSPSATDDLLTNFAQRLVFNPASPVVAEYKNSYLHTDPEFRITLGKEIGEAGWSDEFANLQHTGLPVGFVFGKEERVINTHYLDDYPHKWRDKVFHIEKAAHFLNAEQPEKFNKLLMEFASDCSEA